MIQITLGDGKLPHIFYEKDGAKRSFEVDHNTLYDFIQMNCFERKVTKTKLDLPVFETPALPPGAAKYMAMPDGRVALFMEQKTFAPDINYHGTIFKAVPLPHLLFMFVFRPARIGDGWEFAERKLFAHKAPVLRDDTELFKWPFAHTYDNNGLCYHFENTIKDFASLSTFVNIWSKAEMSDHFFSRNGVDRNLWVKPLREIFEETSGTKKFQFDKLLTAKTSMRELANQIVRGYFPENELHDIEEAV